MLRDKEIDIIAIYTPDHLHAEHVKHGLAATNTLSAPNLLLMI
jgi:predicted dehydrogenase